MTARGSLGGQNSYGRISGTRSSRVLSILFQRLRKLDREIGLLDYQISHDNFFCIDKKRAADRKERRAKLDAKRRQVRAHRKGYAPPPSL